MGEGSDVTLGALVEVGAVTDAVGEVAGEVGSIVDVSDMVDWDNLGTDREAPIGR